MPSSTSSYSRVLSLNEKDYQTTLVHWMRASQVSVQAHSDSVSSDIPDLSFSYQGVNGWIEVKYLPRDPTPGRIPFEKPNYFTKGQERYLREAGTAGGHCYLWVGTPSEARVFGHEELSALRSQRWGDTRGRIRSLTPDVGAAVAAFLNLIR